MRKQWKTQRTGENTGKRGKTKGNRRKHTKTGENRREKLVKTSRNT